MQPELSAPHPPQRPSWKRPATIPPVRFRRWYVSPPESHRSSNRSHLRRSIPLLATIAIGYGITHYAATRSDSPYQLAEEERIRKNRELMDAYGYKEDVNDLQKALEAYEIQ
ncbi:hypothetical protein BJX76DRAFT_360004 [Aspergillus varians]